MALPPLGNSDHVVVSVSIDFSSNSQWDALFHRIAYDCSRAGWDGLHDHLNFVSGFGLELMYISIIKNIRSSLIHLHGFSASCAAAIVHRNHFLRLCQKYKSSDSKVKFTQASNRCKGFLKLPNLHVLIKQKSPLLPRNFALMTSGELPIVFSTRVNLLYLFSIQWPGGVVFCI